MGQDLGCFPLLALIIGAALWLRYESAKSEQKELDNARSLYEQALAKLKTDPANAGLRQNTLALGRHYSFLTRRRKGVTVFDELALMNDINAASAGAAALAQPTLAADSKPSAEERLATLSALKSKGLIDDQEYASRRQKILDEL